jgi:tRNA-dihydrouridine synthase C
MLGRGAVADPWLAARIQAHDAGLDSPRAGWPELAPALLGYWRRVRQAVQPKHQAGRVKQWLHYLRRAHPQAEAAYQGLRTEANPAQFDGLLRALLREHALLV